MDFFLMKLKSQTSSSLPAFNSTKKRKRKKAVAGLPVVEVVAIPYIIYIDGVFQGNYLITFPSVFS